MQKDGEMRAAFFQAAKQALLMELYEYIHKERQQLPLTWLQTWHGKKKTMRKQQKTDRCISLGLQLLHVTCENHFVLLHYTLH